MSRDDVTVTPEEMAQAIENAQTAVFRDPPWSPNARAFLALLADRDALRAELDAAHDGEDALRSEVARLRAQVAALQAEDRRVGPDEVVVPRSAAEYAILAFDWIECPDSEHYEASRAFHDALRTSAQAHQAHNGEESK